MTRERDNSIVGMRDGGSYLVPFILVTSLFFLWGFAHSILDVLNKHFQDVLVISKGRSGLVQAVVYGGYFLMALPAGKIMERFGYRVGVVVDEDARTVLARVREYRLDYVQLHGHESSEYCRALQRQGLSLIKAFSIGCVADLERTAPYEGLCRYFLFDTACKGYGGSGHSFDWRVLRRYAGSVPFLLSGGIGLHNAEALKQVEHPLLAGYDLNSRFELSPGRKDAEKIQQFIELLTCNTDE